MSVSLINLGLQASLTKFGVAIAWFAPSANAAVLPFGNTTSVAQIIDSQHAVPDNDDDPMPEQSDADIDNKVTSGSDSANNSNSTTSTTENIDVVVPYDDDPPEMQPSKGGSAGVGSQGGNATDSKHHKHGTAYTVELVFLYIFVAIAALCILGICIRIGCICCNSS